MQLTQYETPAMIMTVAQKQCSIVLCPLVYLLGWFFSMCFLVSCDSTRLFYCVNMVFLLSSFSMSESFGKNGDIEKNLASALDARQEFMADVVKVPIRLIISSIRRAFILVTGCAAAGQKIVRDVVDDLDVETLAGVQIHGMQGVRPGLVAIPERLKMELKTGFATLIDLKKSNNVFEMCFVVKDYICNYLQTVGETFGAASPIYFKIQAFLFEVFAVLYGASKVLMFVDPLFYLIPNAVYFLTFLNAGMFYITAEADQKKIEILLDQIAAVINRRLANGESREVLLSELGILLGDFRMISDPEALQRRLESVLTGLYR